VFFLLIYLFFRE